MRHVQRIHLGNKILNDTRRRLSRSALFLLALAILESQGIAAETQLRDAQGTIFFSGKSGEKFVLGSYDPRTRTVWKIDSKTNQFIFWDGNNQKIWYSSHKVEGPPKPDQPEKLIEKDLDNGAENTKLFWARIGLLKSVQDYFLVSGIQDLASYPSLPNHPNFKELSHYIDSFVFDSKRYLIDRNSFAVRPFALSDFSQLSHYFDLSSDGRYLVHFVLNGKWVNHHQYGASILAYASGDLKFYDTTTGEDRLLLKDIFLVEGAEDPVFSPANRKVAYVTVDDGQKLSADFFESVTSFFPTSTFALHNKIGLGVYVLDLETGQTRRVSDGFWPVWRKDGQALMVRNFSKSKSGALRIVDLRDLVNTQEITLKHAWGPSTEFFDYRENFAVWSPDGKYIAYAGAPQAWRERWLNAFEHFRKFEIWIVQSDGREEHSPNLGSYEGLRLSWKD